MAFAIIKLTYLILPYLLSCTVSEI